MTELIKTQVFFTNHKENDTFWSSNIVCPDTGNTVHKKQLLFNNGEIVKTGNVLKSNIGKNSVIFDLIKICESWQRKVHF